jgi:hypothetical protein
MLPAIPATRDDVALPFKNRAAGRKIGLVNAVSRMALIPIALLTMAVFSLAGPAAADPPPTQVITAVAVGPNGQPINGYQEAPGPGNVAEVNDCTTASPSAVANNVYSCSPSAAGAGTCWPSTPGSLLCVDNAWDKRLHRVTFGGQLPPVQPIAIPEPFAMLLDDGTRCLQRNGGAWGGRDDGYVGTNLCGDPSANLAVLWLPSRGPAPGPASTARRRRGRSKSVNWAHRPPTFRHPSPTR